MKRFLKISALSLAAILGFAACDNDEFVYVPEEPQVEIINSDIIFDANGGTGTVTVKAEGSISATCTSEWCSVSASGNTITATAQPNYGLDGRAAQILVTCNNQVTKLTAQQTGMVFTYVDAQYVVEMAGGDIVINGNSTLPTTYEADDWIKVDNGLGAYLLTIGKNDSGDTRTGTVKISAGDVSATITIVQKFDRDFSGEYTFWRYKSSSETDANHVSADVTITRDANDPDLYNVTGWNGVTIPLHFDATRNQLYIENVVYYGQYTDGNYLYGCKNFVNDSGGSYLSYTTGNANYYTWFDFEYVGGKYNILFNNDPPTSSYMESTGFTIYTFTVAPDSGTAPATANRVSSIWIVRRPQFLGK